MDWNQKFLKCSCLWSHSLTSLIGLSDWKDFPVWLESYKNIQKKKEVIISSLVQSEISLQILDGFRWNLTFVVPEDEPHRHCGFPDLSASTTMRLTFFFFLVKCPDSYQRDCHEIGTDIQVQQRMNPNDCDPLTLHVVPPAGQSFHLSSEITMLQTFTALWLVTKSAGWHFRFTVEPLIPSGWSVITPDLSSGDIVRSKIRFIQCLWRSHEPQLICLVLLLVC